MQSLRCRPGQFAIIISAFFLLLLLIAGCVISPRRIVNQTPSPTPTPDISPTPTPGITPTPTPTPTPTGLDKTVPKFTGEFLFLGDAGAPLLTGYSINSDGSLAPIPGSPFTISAPARALRSVQDFLIVESESGASAFKVDRETGLLKPRDSQAAMALSASALQPSAISGSQTAVLDASGRFMYVLDTNRAELLAFQVENGKLSQTPVIVYRLSNSTISIALITSSH
jgi:hypothetical protein